MTADPVAEALRECAKACPCYYRVMLPVTPRCDNGILCECWPIGDIYNKGKPCLWLGHAAIARYGEACRQAGVDATRLPVGNHIVIAQEKYDEAIAAARREGRLEEIERMWPRIAGSEGQWESLARWAIQERDRLRSGRGTSAGCMKERRIHMSDALEKARRETETWCTCCRRVGCAYQAKDEYASCCQMLHRAIARLESAARGEGERAERESAGFCEKHIPNASRRYAACWVCSREEETQKVAAARLAGRQEAFEFLVDYTHQEGCPPSHQEFTEWSEERLRREAGGK